MTADTPSPTSGAARRGFGAHMGLRAALRTPIHGPGVDPGPVLDVCERFGRVSWT